MGKGNAMEHEQSVAAYFDARADGWLQMEASTASPLQPAVAALAGVGPGARVLDIGCGLGVMMSTYLQLDVAFVLGVDVSSRMVSLAQERWAAEERVSFAVGDAAHMSFEKPFDSVVIYNAYPHLMDRPALVRACAAALVPGGRFVVAHSTGRQHINAHHEAQAAGVSLPLGPADEESHVWRSRFSIDGIVDAPRFFAFCGSLF